MLSVPSVELVGGLVSEDPVEVELLPLASALDSLVVDTNPDVDSLSVDNVVEPLLSDVDSLAADVDADPVPPIVASTVVCIDVVRSVVQVVAAAPVDSGPLASA